MSSELDSGCSSAEDGKVGENPIDSSSSGYLVEKESQVDKIPSSDHDDGDGQEVSSDVQFDETETECKCTCLGLSDSDSENDSEKIEEIRKHLLQSLDFDDEDDGDGWDTLENLDKDLDEAEEDALNFIPFPPNLAQHMEQMRRRVEEANRIWDSIVIEENDKEDIIEKVSEENGRRSGRRKVTFKNEPDLVDIFLFERDESELELMARRRTMAFLALQNEVSHPKDSPESDCDDFEERILENLSFIAIGTAIKKPDQCGDGLANLNDLTDDDDTSVDDYICSCSCSCTNDFGQNLEPSEDDDSSYLSSSQNDQNDQKTDQSSALIRTIFNYQNILLLKNLKKSGGAAAEVKKYIEHYGITRDMLKCIFNEKFLQLIYDGKLRKSFNHVRPPTAPSRAQQGRYLRLKSSQLSIQESQDHQEKEFKNPILNYANERPKSAKMTFYNSNDFEYPSVFGPGIQPSPAAAGDGFILLRPSSSPVHLNSPKIVQKVTVPKSTPEDLKVPQVKKNQKKTINSSDSKPSKTPNHPNKVKNKGPVGGKSVNNVPERERKVSDAFEKWLDKKRKSKNLSNSMTNKLFHPNLVLLTQKYGTYSGSVYINQSSMKKMNNNTKTKKSSSIDQIQQHQDQPIVDQGFTNINKINGPPSTRLLTINPRFMDTYNVYRYGGPPPTRDSKIIKNYRTNYQYNNR